MESVAEMSSGKWAKRWKLSKQHIEWKTIIHKIWLFCLCLWHKHCFHCLWKWKRKHFSSTVGVLLSQVHVNKCNAWLQQFNLHFIAYSKIPLFFLYFPNSVKTNTEMSNIYHIRGVLLYARVWFDPTLHKHKMLLFLMKSCKQNPPDKVPFLESHDFLGDFIWHVLPLLCMRFLFGAYAACTLYPVFYCVWNLWGLSCLQC